MVYTPGQAKIDDIAAAYRARLGGRVLSAASVDPIVGATDPIAAAIDTSCHYQPPVVVNNQPVPANVDRAKLVAIWPSLSRLAILAGLGPELRLWIVCQYINSQRKNTGWVTFGEIVEATGWTPGTIRRLLDSALSIFIGGISGKGKESQIFFNGQETVCSKLRRLAATSRLYDANEPERGRWLVAIDIVSGSLAEFYAGCFEGWIGLHKGYEYRITWELLGAAWGRSRPQLLTWIDLADVNKINNRGCIELPKNATYDSVYAGGLRVPFVIDRSDDKTFAYFYRGNTYRVGGHWRRVTTRGKYHKLNRAGVVGGSWSIDANDDPEDAPASTSQDSALGRASEQLADRSFRRHNFTRVSAYNQAAKRNRGYLYLMIGQSRNGRMWDYTHPA
jgi:hypothetical protein